ncbi:hypothetical protein EFA69_14650 [Rufibacter immobilis]|uniref:Uncharacterized protein n=1 Tax=Rufibacter immobilis TaxID=1348778 RepID=A0A3M9MPD1_9BACT|nr:hypothetical protein [Rufibacter immobilis]RNI27376.1 hypothetical protein EFA69_14650 [Rufibacter immobilis]
MNQVPRINIPFEQLKSIVLDTLERFEGSFEFKNLCNMIGATAVQKGLVSNPHPTHYQTFYFPLQREDENLVREIIWNLIVERVVTIGDYHNDSWPWLSLTDYGKTVIGSLQPTPHDPSGYMDRLKREVPELDGIIETYLSESIRTYSINQLLSSTITLGCASEKALLLLIDTYAETFRNGQAGQRFGKRVEGKFIKTQYEEFDKDFKRHLGQLPYELRDGYTNTLLGVFEMIRRNRNSAGHPTGKQIDKDTLFANLQVFIPYCKYIYDLKEYLEESSHD